MMLALVAAAVAICLFAGRTWRSVPDSHAVASADSNMAVPEMIDNPELPAAVDELFSRIEGSFEGPFDGAVGGAVESWNEFLATSTANSSWLEPVATPIRPLADSMTSTLNVLLQTIPTRRRIHQRPEINAQDSAIHVWAFDSVA